MVPTNITESPDFLPRWKIDVFTSSFHALVHIQNKTKNIKIIDNLLALAMDNAWKFQLIIIIIKESKNILDVFKRFVQTSKVDESMRPTGSAFAASKCLKSWKIIQKKN